jgi:hypothetical protein
MCFLYLNNKYMRGYIKNQSRDHWEGGSEGEIGFLAFGGRDREILDPQCSNNLQNKGVVMAETGGSPNISTI